MTSFSIYSIINLHIAVHAPGTRKSLHTNSDHIDLPVYQQHAAFHDLRISPVNVKQAASEEMREKMNMNGAGGTAWCGEVVYQAVWEENNMTDEVMNSGVPARPHASNSRQRRTAV